MSSSRIPFCMHRTGALLLLMCVAIGVRICGWQLGLPAAALLLLSLLLHEAGHIITATLLRVPVSEVGMTLAGTYIKRSRALCPRDEILIAASGPLMNLLAVIPFLFLPRLGPQLAACNLILGVTNLLPLPYSDGLRIVRNLSGAIIPSHSNPA